MLVCGGGRSELRDDRRTTRTWTTWNRKKRRRRRRNGVWQQRANELFQNVGPDEFWRPAYPQGRSSSFLPVSCTRMQCTPHRRRQPVHMMVHIYTAMNYASFLFFLQSLSIQPAMDGYAWLLASLLHVYILLCRRSIPAHWITPVQVEEKEERKKLEVSVQF